MIAAEAFAFGPEKALAVGVSVTLLSTAVLAAGIVYARNCAQAFCVGAAATALATRFLVVLTSPSPIALGNVFYSMIASWFATTSMNSVGVQYGVVWSFAIGGGLLAMLVRWLTDNESGDAQPRSGDRI